MDWYRVSFGFETRGYNECEGSAYSIEDRQLTPEELLYPERYLYPKAIPQHDAVCQIDVRSVSFERITQPESAESVVEAPISLVAIALLALWFKRRRKAA